jgi:mannose-6-phosphate isomerase-like protein (cupin superfamily)
MPVLPAPKSPTHVVDGGSFTSLATPSRGSVTNSLFHVEMAAGAPPVPHEVTREVIFVVTSGRADVQIGDERSEAAVGDAVVVPPDTRFSIASCSSEPLRALCCFPVGCQARLLDGTVLTPPWTL